MVLPTIQRVTVSTVGRDSSRVEREFAGKNSFTEFDGRSDQRRLYGYSEGCRALQDHKEHFPWVENLGRFRANAAASSNGAV